MSLGFFAEANCAEVPSEIFSLSNNWRNGESRNHILPTKNSRESPDIGFLSKIAARIFDKELLLREKNLDFL